MKKAYERASLEVIRLETKDIITTSGDISWGGSDDDIGLPGDIL